MGKNDIKICTYQHLMGFSSLQYRIKFTLPEDQTVKCSVFSVKNKLRGIARHQPSELFENLFVQVILSSLANVKLNFNVKKHFSSKP